MKKTFEEIVEIPAGIEAEMLGPTRVKLKSGQKQIEKKFKVQAVELRKDGNKIIVSSDNAKKKTLATINTICTHIKNAMHGLQKGYEYKLEIVYSHFPMKVKVGNGVVEIDNLVGAKQARKARILEGVTVQVKGKDVIVNGYDKDNVGQTAANIESASKVRGGKDIRNYQDGVYIVSKPKNEKSA